MRSSRRAATPGLGAKGRPGAANLASSIWGTGERVERGRGAGEKEMQKRYYWIFARFGTTSKQYGQGSFVICRKYGSLTGQHHKVPKCYLNRSLFKCQNQNTKLVTTLNHTHYLVNHKRVLCEHFLGWIMAHKHVLISKVEYTNILWLSLIFTYWLNSSEPKQSWNPHANHTHLNHLVNILETTPLQLVFDLVQPIKLRMSHDLVPVQEFTAKLSQCLHACCCLILWWPHCLFVSFHNQKFCRKICLIQ